MEHLGWLIFAQKQVNRATRYMHWPFFLKSSCVAPSCSKKTSQLQIRKQTKSPKPYSIHVSGQIGSRPHTTDFPQKVAFSKGNPPAISGKSRLVKH